MFLLCVKSDQVYSDWRQDRNNLKIEGGGVFNMLDCFGPI